MRMMLTVIAFVLTVLFATMCFGADWWEGNKGYIYEKTEEIELETSGTLFVYRKEMSDDEWYVAMPNDYTTSDITFCYGDNQITITELVTILRELSPGIFDKIYEKIKENDD